MKYMIIAAVISFFLIGTGIYTNNYVAHSAEALLNQAEKMEASAKEGNWQEAKNQLNHLNTSWRKTNYMWTIMLDHQELDNINQSMVKAEQFLDTKYMPGFMVETAQLKMFLKHIPQKDVLNLQNIL